MPVVKPTRVGWRGATKNEWQPLPFMEDYVDELKVNQRAKGYIAKVELGLGHFATFCWDEQIKHPEEIERRHLLRFQGWLLEHREWKPAYRQQLMKYVRGWIYWLANTHQITTNPWYQIKIGVTPKQPNPLSDDELGALFDQHRKAMYSLSPFYYHRREVILVFLYGWGLRIHELEALNVLQLDARLETVSVRQKGGSYKELPYNSVMKECFMRYTRVRGQYAVPGEDALIIDTSGKRLSIDMLRKIVVELGQAAGLDIHPHQLRDTCGTNLLDSDMEAERVQKVLGHSTLKQTLAYSRVNINKVAEAHEKAMSPRLTKLVTGKP